MMSFIRTFQAWIVKGHHTALIQTDPLFTMTLPTIGISSVVPCATSNPFPASLFRIVIANSLRWSSIRVLRQLRILYSRSFARYCNVNVERLRQRRSREITDQGFKPGIHSHDPIDAYFLGPCTKLGSTNSLVKDEVITMVTFNLSPQQCRLRVESTGRC